MKLWSSPWLYCLKELQIINRGKQVTSLRRRFKSHLSLVHIFSCPSVFGSCNTVFVLACNRDRPLPPHLMATLLAPSVLPASKPDHRATRPPPKGTSSLRMFLWRQRIWFESTFVLSMLEPWEKVLLCEFQRPEFRKTSVTFTSVSMLALFFFLVITGLFKYLPHHLNVMHRRAVYYFFGQEGDPRQWLGLGKVGLTSENLLKEL